MKVAITTLGCDKNTVDSETLAGALKSQGYTLVARDKDADIIVVNTCAFIKSARDEAVKVIKSKLSLRGTKQSSPKVIVTGCITVKHKNLIPSGVEVWEIGKHSGQKLLSTPKSYTYIKISDGCDNHCSYCTIPSIRGKYIARPESEILAEITHFASLGVGEFILVAQDLTKYPSLVSLIHNISIIKGVKRIRLHYIYPSGITDDLVQEIVFNPKVCKYLDIPFQHVSPRILELMHRKPIDPLALVKELQSHNITIRSTFMLGFPTETEEDFQMLCEFLRQAKLDYVGFFKYSREPETPAHSLPQIDAKTKLARLKTAQAIQNTVLTEKHNELIGKTLKVVCDFNDDVLGYSIVRSERMSPDVDPVIIVSGNLQVGRYCDVKVTGVKDENLLGEEES
jgi:ribosomal protein S12 methylthiotransferase